MHIALTNFVIAINLDIIGILGEQNVFERLPAQYAVDSGGGSSGKYFFPFPRLFIIAGIHYCI